MQKRSKIALGTVLAAGAGYLAGVLTAPKSGRETRDDIRKKALAAKTEGEKKLKKMYSELDALLAQVNEKAKKSKEKLSVEVKESVATAESAKLKAKELLTAIHEGEAEDKDLSNAITDAKKAITNLKQYLAKKA